MCGVLTVAKMGFRQLTRERDTIGMTCPPRSHSILKPDPLFQECIVGYIV